MHSRNNVCHDVSYILYSVTPVIANRWTMIIIQTSYIVTYLILLILVLGFVCCHETFLRWLFYFIFSIETYYKSNLFCDRSNHYFSSEIIIIRNNDIYQSYNMNEIPAITGKICPDPLITRNTNSFKCNWITVSCRLAVK